MRKFFTLSIIHQPPRVLLGMKKRGFGAGRWNGFGGKVKEGETIEAAARREIEEEAGIRVDHPELTGVIDFSFQGKPEEILEVNIFRVTDFQGTPVETEEMRPQWFDTGKIPFAEMWSSDRHWFPFFLEGKRFRGQFLFGEGDVVLKGEVIPMEEV